MRWIKLTLFFIFTGFQLTPLHASDDIDLELNGFISAAVGGIFNSNNPSAAFGRRGSGTGYRESLNASPDTSIGLQASIILNDKTTAVGQFISRGEDFETEADWVYISYELSTDWTVRAGRFRAPYYHFSDYLDVGYAYPWIRAPIRTYSSIFSSVNGLDAIWQGNIGDWDIRMQSFWGEMNDTYELGSGEQLDVRFSEFGGINATFGNEWLSIRGSYTRTRLTADVPSDVDRLIIGGVRDLQASVDSALPGAGALYNDAVAAVERYMADDDELLEYLALSFVIDIRAWYFILEGTELIVEEQTVSSSDEKSAILSLGYRFDRVMPYILFDTRKNYPDFGFLDTFPIVGVPSADSAAEQLKDGIIGVIGAEKRELDRTIGVRWDYSRATAFKFEFTHSRLKVEDIKVIYNLVAAGIDVIF